MKQKFTGVVQSTNMDKTAVVKVDRMVTHRVYGKKYRVSKQYLVHDPQNMAVVGETVSFAETAPISKRKRWIIQTAETAKDES